jgi:hypothetical protein
VKDWSEKYKYAKHDLERKKNIMHDLKTDNVRSAQIIRECLLEARINGAFHGHGSNYIMLVDFPDVILRNLDYIEMLRAHGASSTGEAWDLLKKYILQGSEGGKVWRIYDINAAVNEVRGLHGDVRVKTGIGDMLEQLRNIAFYEQCVSLSYEVFHQRV